MRGSFVWVVGLVGVLGISACGGDEKSPVEEQAGGVRVVVQNVQSENAKKIVVDLVPDGHPAGETYRFNLKKDGTTWGALLQNVYVDNYIVEARAFDREDANPDSASPLFRSNPVRVNVPHNDVASVFLLLHEETAPGEERLPSFASVVLSRETVEQWETLEIAVEARGSNRPMHLSGFPAPGTPPDFRGSFSADATFAFPTGSELGAAALTWQPPKHEGPRQLYLQITDARGNIAEMGIWVNVGKNVGSIDLDAAFNHAPVVELRPLIRNDDEGTTVLLWLFVEDDRSRVDEEEILYEWTTTCNGTFVTSGGYAPSEGAYVEEPTQLGPLGTSFRYEIAAVNLPASNECELFLTVTDYEDNEDGDPEAGASRVLRLKVDTELLTPQTP